MVIGFQAIHVSSLFRKVLDSCTRIRSLVFLFGIKKSVRLNTSSAFSNHSDWLSKIFPRPFVSQTQTFWSSFSPSSTTLFLPVYFTRKPKIPKIFPACWEIFFISFTRASSTENLVSALSSRIARISWVASSSR